jgi:hypothetical protein
MTWTTVWSVPSSLPLRSEGLCKKNITEQAEHYNPTHVTKPAAC